MMEPQLLQLFLQLGALGILGYVAVWLTRWFPKAANDVIQTFNGQQSHFDAERTLARDNAREDRDALVKVMERERQICLDQHKAQLEMHRAVLEKLISDRSVALALAQSVSAAQPNPAQTAHP